MFAALLAYDCSIAPGHPAQGKARDTWDCLWRVASCDDVSKCVFPTGEEACSDAGGTACGIAGGGSGPTDLDTRIECTTQGAKGESCALWGQTCLETSAGASCSASRTVETGAGCFYGCSGSVLHDCTPDAGDVGIDCADNGGQQCKVFADVDAGWAACVPVADAGGCDASKDVTCTPAGVALSCPAGRAEGIDCTDLLQSASACNPGTQASGDFDWTSPCSVRLPADAGPDAAPCTPACSGTHLVDCYRNAPFDLDCHEAGLGLCGMVTTDLGSRTSPACGPPHP
jgi:hypothetical protein